ncbi:MAG: hypothetical protein V3U96_08935 [Paracoccaceae bacterium]
MNSGFPLVPDDFHLQHVGKTVQGNGYWICNQLAPEDGSTRDFLAAYVFDKTGNLISSEVLDQGLRSSQSEQTTEELIRKLMKKIDAKEIAEILVKPFSVSFYGHIFGLVIREMEEGGDAEQDMLIDAMPGHTLMFYGPWSLCNYDT